jgi:predicted aspartyl protease
MRAEIVALFYAFAAWRASDGVPLHVMSGAVALDRVRVNGEGPYRFLLDTGAQTCALGRGLAAHLGVKANSRALLATVGGEAWTPVATARLSVGSAGEGRLVEVLLFDVPGFDGVIGQSFLSQLDYVIDYGKRRFVVEPAVPPGRQVNYDLADGRIMIPADAPGRALHLVLDSGASNVVLYGGSPVGGATGVVRSHLGTAAARTAQLAWLRVGDAVMRRVSAAIVPDRAARWKEDGLLPARSFRSVYVNSRDRFIILDPTGY